MIFEWLSIVLIVLHRNFIFLCFVNVTLNHRESQYFFAFCLKSLVILINIIWLKDLRWIILSAIGLLNCRRRFMNWHKNRFINLVFQILLAFIWQLNVCDFADFLQLTASFHWIFVLHQFSLWWEPDKLVDLILTYGTLLDIFEWSIIIFENKRAWYLFFFSCMP